MTSNEFRGSCMRMARFAIAAIGLTATMLSPQAQPSASSGMDDAKQQGATVKRDPFWPVGYVPKNIQSALPRESSAAIAVAVDSSWDEAMKKVVINGVSSRADNEYFAVINGAVKSVGDTVTVNLGGTTYTWAVEAIEPPGAVKLRRISAR